jgi:hypothetical protein
MINYRLGGVTFSVLPCSFSLYFTVGIKIKVRSGEIHSPPYLSAERSIAVRIISEQNASLPLPLFFASFLGVDGEAADCPDSLPVAYNFLTKKIVLSLT